MRIPLAVPNLSGREGEYLQQCVESTFVSTAGPFVGEFADRIAQVSGTASASVTCAGTVALQMALEALGVGVGDLVIVPSLSFIATANSISHSGAKPWFFDVDPGSWTLNLDLVVAELDRATEPARRGRRHVSTGQTVRAIMPVMTMGASMDLGRVAEIASAYDLEVVVDAAAAIGATDADDRPLGASGVSAVCYSFNGNKTVTSGGGGAVAAADAGVVERIDHLISTGRVGRDYDHDVIGYNFRMTNLEAAVGVAQIEQLDRFLDRKHDVYRAYSALADRVDALAAFPTPARGRSVHWFSGVHYLGDDPTAVPNFLAHMRSSEIDVRPFWKPIHQQVPYRPEIHTDMPVTDDLWARIVPLPCSTGITDEDLDAVVETAAQFWRERG